MRPMTPHLMPWQLQTIWPGYQHRKRYMWILSKLPSKKSYKQLEDSPQDAQPAAVSSGALCYLTVHSRTAADLEVATISGTRAHNHARRCSWVAAEIGRA